MPTNASRTFTEFGQSIWYDNVRRSALENGEFAGLVAAGVRGCTSNPAIFNNSIGGSSDYDSALRRLVGEGLNVDEIYYQLVTDDIRATADQLFDVYESSNYKDGYVSVEVLPELATNTRETVEEAVNLYSTIQRANLMIKVPATAEGLPAITELVGRGISVNVTLIFSRQRYREVALAYLAGLEKAHAAGIDLGRIASVASFFVSRVDAAVDKWIEAKAAKDPSKQEALLALRGKAAVANAKLAYADFEQIFESERFQKLKANGAQVQRLLWASTGTKSAAYPDTLYVDSLIGQDTVNTVPPATLDAFLDHGTPQASLKAGSDDARRALATLADHGLDLSSVCEDLLDAGVHSFIAAMDSLKRVIGSRRAALIEGTRERQRFDVGVSEAPVQHALDNLTSQKTVRGIWAKDNLTFTKDAAHEKSIKNRLGWLDAPSAMLAHLDELRSFSHDAYLQGFRKVLLMGMGGSSLCPEVMSLIFDKLPGFAELKILDSTDPAAVSAAEQWADLESTLFIVASKSGGTIEVRSFEAHFWQLAQKKFGDRAGSRFVAITDPGSPLATLAAEKDYLRAFENPADIGGRYSAISLFGLVPAALVGVDVERLLQDAERMASACAPAVPPRENPGALLGAFLAGNAQSGRDKLTLIASEKVKSLGSWIEQLVAESIGKVGKGIVPIDGEPLHSPENYAKDRCFVYIRYGSNEPTELDRHVEGLTNAGLPVATLCLLDLHNLGGEFFRWEMATSIAGALMDLNPFDEPNVTEAKTATQKLIGEYEASGVLPAASGVPVGDAQITQTLQQAAKGDYIVLSAYLRQTAERDALFTQLRSALGKTQQCASAVGYGPRFLHSTGQLHKGGPNTGVFLVLTSKATADIEIPGQKYSFATLRDAQALGDLQVLKARGRRVVHVDLGEDEDAGLLALVNSLGG